MTCTACGPNPLLADLMPAHAYAGAATYIGCRADRISAKAACLDGVIGDVKASPG